jgi:thermitase
VTARRAAALLAAIVLFVVGSGVALASNDPDFDVYQYGPQHIYAPDAWTVSRGAGVTIAIVDSGVQLDHPDLRDKIVPGYDFADDDDDPDDINGHGTHVAGIAAAITDNGIGMAGIAPDAKIMPLRVPTSGDEGSANIAQAILSISQAIRYAASNGAEVVNLSLVSDLAANTGFDQITNACREALASGVLCVAGSGNDGRAKPSRLEHEFPGIVVGATDKKDEVAEFSQNADTQWAVVAPGVGIHSTWLDSSYRPQQGTSMATPHVSGVAALLFGQGLGVQQVIDRIVTTARPLNDGGGMSGAGLVNAAAAVGAEFTPATTAPRVTTTTSTTVAGGGGSPTTTTLAGEDEVAAPVDLSEGVIDDADFAGLDAEQEQFLDGSALGDTLEPIKLSKGFEASFVIGVLVFVAALAAIGVAVRRLVVRRGIGAMKSTT